MGSLVFLQPSDSAPYCVGKGSTDDGGDIRAVASGYECAAQDVWGSVIRNRSAPAPAVPLRYTICLSSQ